MAAVAIGNFMSLPFGVAEAALRSRPYLRKRSNGVGSSSHRTVNADAGGFSRT
jgi:hypothetical protein